MCYLFLDVGLIVYAFRVYRVYRTLRSASDIRQYYLNKKVDFRNLLKLRFLLLLFTELANPLNMNIV